jgi:cytochrome c
MARVLKSLLATLLAAWLTSPAMATDPVTGARVFQGQCSVCHSVSRSGPAGIGPRLFGVVGRKAGVQAGFNYSQAMKISGITWTVADLKRYIASPSGTVRGNKMPYAGLHNAQQLDDLIAYLVTLH